MGRGKRPRRKSEPYLSVSVDVMFDELEAREPDHFAVKQYRKYKLAAGVVCSKRLLNQAVGKSLRTHNLKPKEGAQVMRKNEKITALYERLSRDDFGKDDDQQRESNSISNQKAMLEEFAARQGFTNIVHFTDDGISGTCFDRPGFLAMMKEVEAGNVEYLCIKDMSRMGRDYLKVGQKMCIRDRCSSRDGHGRCRPQTAAGTECSPVPCGAPWAWASFCRPYSFSETESRVSSPFISSA